MSPNKKRPTRRALGDPSRPINLRRHRSHCAVCHHPDREAIEEEFLHWRSPYDISADYEIENHSSIYRHAHAFGLFARRRCNLRSAVERMIERGERAKITANTLLRAIRTYSQMTDDGQCLEPPRQVVVTHIFQTSSSQPAQVPQAIESSPKSLPSECAESFGFAADELRRADPDQADSIHDPLLPANRKQIRKESSN
jgi:hypothetical protein